MDDRRLVSFYARGGKVKRPKMALPVETPMDAMPMMKKGGKVKDTRPAEDLLKKGGRAKMAKGGNPMEGRFSTGIVVPRSRQVRGGFPVVGVLGRMR